MNGAGALVGIVLAGLIFLAGIGVLAWLWSAIRAQPKAVRIPPPRAAAAVAVAPATAPPGQEWQLDMGRFDAPPADLWTRPRVPLGPGTDFDFAIVGESNYQAALKKLAGARLKAGETVVIDCLVVPEPENKFDPCAVAVYAVEGQRKIGYFSRDDGEEWADLIGHLEQNGSVGECEGYCRGGTGNKKSIGVWLSMREPEELADEWGVVLD